MSAARTFERTWWGRAWIEALEHRAGIDPGRLPRGRTYARQDRVGRVEIAPGRITALVRGTRALPYRVSVDVPTHPPDAWTAVAAAIAERSGHAAALLDGELDPELVAAADAARVALLPGPGDLRTRCSCPDLADPCKHAAATCYVAADAIDADPFVLFELRGIERTALLERVREERTARARPRDGEAAGSLHDDPATPGAGPGGSGRMVAAAFGGGAVVDPGMPARLAWSRTPSAPPPRRELPPQPGEPSGWPAEAPRDAPFTAAGLHELAADAAQRAWAQLGTGESSALDLDETTDLARRAAQHLDRGGSLLELARRSGTSSAQLTHRALAWRNAGRDGLDAIEETLWRPPPSVVARALEAFADAGIDPDDVQVRSNRFTIGDIQLRVTSDDRWWRFERRGRAWELVEPPAVEPDDLISGP